SGGCTGTSTTCNLTMDADKSVTATFAGNKTLSLTLTGGNGTDSVTFTPPGTSCTATCGKTYAPGTSVALTATPDTNEVFTGWSGDCSGTSTCNLTMDANKSVTATFAAKKTLSLTVTGNGTD